MDELIDEVQARHAELREWERQVEKANADLHLAEEGCAKARYRLGDAKRELFMTITGETNQYALPKADA